MEKQSYEDRISTMMREKEMLEDTFKTLDTKVAQMRRYLLSRFTVLLLSDSQL